MARSQQRLLAQLATSDNELASGLGQCLEALRLISALPRASPVFVKYSASSHVATTKAFGRDHLSRVPLRVRLSLFCCGGTNVTFDDPLCAPPQTVISLIKSSLSLADPIHVTTALFFREDGTVDPTPVLVDEDSWKELAPYVHTLHVEDDIEQRPSTAHSTLSTLSGSVFSVANGNASANGNGSPPGAMSISRGSGLNSNASTFVPSPNAITIKTGEGGPKVSLQSLRKPSFSPSCLC
ncbi:hypothetical protein HD554DRAFT_2077981 [Boletus coccyginus]|nr:hypothetical protein HD554DRAFT_2146060 [Boletus coccyginus]KAI9571070.1 hypothetical protein HD554DRAFT_2077981 [Boletus coccyginus]